MSDGPPSAPRATVLIACVNDGPALRESTESALAQGAMVEVVICAADEAAARHRLGGLERVEIRPAETSDATPSTLFAEGLRAAASPWVLFLRADDRLGADCIARLLAVADATSSEVVFARPQAIEGGGSTPPACPEREAERLAALLGGRVWPLATGLVRRASLLEIGGVDPVFAVLPEVDLWLRLVARGAVATTDEAVVRVRWPRAEAIAEIVDAERGLAVARIVDEFATAWRPRQRAAAATTRGEMRVELARALLREAGPEAMALAMRLLRDARGLGVLVPEGAPFDEVRALAPSLCDEVAADPEPGADGPRASAASLSPAAPCPARQGSRRLVVAVGID